MSQPRERNWPGRELPGGLAGLNKKRKKRETAAASSLPKWIVDEGEKWEAIRKRVEEAFRLYTLHTSIQDIAEEIGVSVPTVYDYLVKGRQMRTLMYARDINEIMMEAISARHQIIRDARKSIQDMKNVSVSPLHTLERLNAAAAAGFNDPVNGNNGHDEESPAADGLVMIGITPDMTRVELLGLELIAKQEQAIEELLGLRDKHAAAGAPKSVTPIMTGNIYLVDASIHPGEEVLGNRMTVIPSNDPRLIDLAQEEEDDGDEEDQEDED